MTGEPRRAGTARRPVWAPMSALCAIGLLTLSIATGVAGAAPGDLDPSFSVDGKATVYGSCCTYYYDLVEPDFSDAALQPDGRIVVSGNSGVHRIKANGAQDTSFSAEYDPAPLAAVAIQPNGKIVAAGYSDDYYIDGDRDFVVLRYNRDGTLDDTFGADGRVVTDFGGHDDEAKSVAMQPDGKVVVAGYSVQLDSEDVPSRDFAIARYEPDGTLDQTFSADGRQTTDFGGSDGAQDVAMQPSGKIVVAGSGVGDLAVARYMPNGAADASFSADGKTTAGFADADGQGGQAVALQPDGRVIVTGGEAGQFALARFNADGSLDERFSGDGRVTTDGFSPVSTHPFVTAANSVVVQGNWILAAGTATGDFALARYLPNGELDPSFSGDGILTTDFASAEDSASAIIPQPDTVIVAGSSNYVDVKYGDVTNFGALARYRMDDGPPDADADGILDPSDLCPNLFEPSAADGCPSYSRGVEVDVVRRHRYAYLDVWAESSDRACLDDATVKVDKVRRGRVKEIRAGGLRLAGQGSRRQLYETRVRQTRGRVYAQIDEDVIPAFGRCSEAKSDFIRLRRR